MAEGVRGDVAIIGYSLYIPGCSDEQDIWQVFSEGRNLAGEFPEARAGFAGVYESGAIAREPRFLKGSYFPDIADFDPHFFGMSFDEACLTDPAQRLLLASAYTAVEHAGYGGMALRNTKTGVYVGYGDSSVYVDMIKKYGFDAVKDDPDRKWMAVTGSLGSLVAGRISHFLGLNGPAVVLDTLCSSSLVAVHQACLAIQSGELDMALAGGIKLELSPLNNEEQRYGFESETGRTSPFDENGAGYARSEAAGAVVLKALHHALRDGDHVHAVIKGSACGHWGNAMSVTAPSYEGVERVALEALRNAGCSAEAVSYVEANGTGVKMSDTMELFGLHRAFRQFTDAKQFCGIGSFKSNLGHPVHAAGIVALIKMILSLKQRRLPALLHLEKPIQVYNFQDSPFYLNSRMNEWQAVQGELLCGINAMGMTGTVCHLLLGEAPKTGERELPADDHPAAPRLFVLSARSESSLHKLVNRFSEYLSRHKAIHLDDLCYTLQTGRGHYEYRLAILFSDRRDLLHRLEAFLNGAWQQEEGMFFNFHRAIGSHRKKSDSCDMTRKELRQLSDQAEVLCGQLAFEPEHAEKWRQLCQFYVEGATVVWDLLYGSRRMRRLPLPTYAYESLTCWFDRLSKPTSDVDISYLEAAPALEAAADHRSVESRIGRMFRTILGLERVDEDCDFIEAGGDSLKLFRLLGQIQNEFEVAVPIDQLLIDPTVRAIAEQVKAAVEQALHQDVQALPAMVGVERSDAGHLLSANQLRLLALHGMEGIGTSYNLPAALELKTGIVPEAIIEAFQKLADRHEILRTSFGYQDGEPRQFVEERIELVPEHYDEEEYGSLDEILEQFVRPFDLGQAPLFRIGLVRRNGKHAVLLFDIHHIIADRTTIDIMLLEMTDHIMNRTVSEPEFHYKDYAHWEQSFFESAAFKEQEKYWLGQYAAPVLPQAIPVDHERSSVQSFAGAILKRSASPALANQVAQLAGTFGATSFVIGFAAYLILLHKYTGGQDLVVGIPVLGRMTKETERMPGMFANTLALRNRIDPGQTVADLIGEVKEHAYAAFAHQLYPLHRLMQQVSAPRESNRNPLFDTCFAWVGRQHSIYILGDEPLSFIEIPPRNTLFDISFNAYDKPDGLELEIVYASKLFERSTIELMMTHYEEIVEQMSEGYDSTVDDVELRTSFRRISFQLDTDDFRF